MWNHRSRWISSRSSIKLLKSIVHSSRSYLQSSSNHRAQCLFTCWRRTFLRSVAFEYQSHLFHSLGRVPIEDSKFSCLIVYWFNWKLTIKELESIDGWKTFYSTNNSSNFIWMIPSFLRSRVHSIVFAIGQLNWEETRERCLKKIRPTSCETVRPLTSNYFISMTMNVGNGIESVWKRFTFITIVYERKRWFLSLNSPSLLRRTNLTFLLSRLNYLFSRRSIWHCWHWCHT